MIRKIQIQGSQNAGVDALAASAALTLAQEVGWEDAQTAEAQLALSNSPPQGPRRLRHYSGCLEAGTIAVVTLAQETKWNMWTTGAVFLAQYSFGEPTKVFAVPFSVTWEEGVPTLMMEVPETPVSEW